MVKNAVIVFLVILVVLLMYQVNALAPSTDGLYAPAPSESTAETATTPGTTAAKPAAKAPATASAPVLRAKDGTYLVSYTDAGFSPATLEITRGSSVKWTNNSSRAMRIDTTDLIDRQPTNELGQSATVGKGGTYSFTFTKPYVYGYANQNNPKDKGVVVVNE